MSRLVKIALFTVMAFFGGLLAAVGAQFWFATHRTTMTIFDEVHSSEPDAMIIDNSDPWIDKDFVLHRVLAVLILLLGIAILGWAAREIFRKPDDSAA